VLFITLAYTPTLNATIHNVTDRRTDRQTTISWQYNHTCTACSSRSG